MTHPGVVDLLDGGETMRVTHYASRRVHETHLPLRDVTAVEMDAAALILSWTDAYVLRLEGLGPDLVRYHALHTLSCVHGTPGMLPEDYMATVAVRHFGHPTLVVLQPDGSAAVATLRSFTEI